MYGKASMNRDIDWSSNCIALLEIRVMRWKLSDALKMSQQVVSNSPGKLWKNADYFEVNQQAIFHAAANQQTSSSIHPTPPNGSDQHRQSFELTWL
jgi:hypothetical protein